MNQNTSGLYSLQNIQKASKELQEKIKKLNFEILPVSEGVKSYFRFDLLKLDYVSECNAFILFHILRDISKNKQDIVIIDHGAGIGFFSFLVKFCGLKCISHDISEDYLEGIKIIGHELNCVSDHFVLGDTNALVSYCRNKQIQPDGLASRNVIEHLPDYVEFFKSLSLFTLTGFSAVITTSANMHNPLVKKIHLKIHEQYENTGSGMDMDNPEVNPSNCGMKLRSEIIKTHFPNIDEWQIQTLARLNRGYVLQEILNRVNQYLETGNLPSRHPDPSNTCDPYTGTWVERLVDSRDYQKAAEALQFNFQLIPGFYNTHYSSKLKNILSKWLNILLKIKNPWSVNISPFLAMKLIKK